MKRPYAPFKRALLCIIMLTGLSACLVKVPSDIIQPEQMEELLYDYHLAQTMGYDLPGGERYKQKLYEKYVFEKHHITEEEFDTSLAWYMRHTNELAAIYKRIDARLSKEKEALTALLTPEERGETLSPEGDSVDIWTGDRLYRFTLSPMSNKMNFVIKADSNFHKGDAFIWKAQVLYLGKEKAKTVAAYTLRYENDSVCGTSQTIDSTGTFALTLPGDSAHALEEVAGYIYMMQANEPRSKEIPDSLKYKPSPLEGPTLLVNDIQLYRIHPEKKTTLKEKIMQ